MQVIHFHTIGIAVGWHPCCVIYIYANSLAAFEAAHGGAHINVIKQHMWLLTQVFLLCAEEWNEAMDKQDNHILRLQSISRSTCDYIQALRAGMLNLIHNTGLTPFSTVHSWCVSATLHGTLARQV